jgi:hypothetical protein
MVRKVGVRKLGAAFLLLIGAGAAGVACNGARTGELEPRYVAVHNALAGLGLVQAGPIQQGSLAEGRDARLRLDLGAGCSTVFALGSATVRDLDVSLLDADDKPVAHDTTREPQAMLRTCPDVAGRYTLVVKMAAGAGDFMVATWTGGVASPSPAGGAAANALALAGAGTCESPLLLAPGAAIGNTRHGQAENAGGCASSDSKELVYKLDVTRRQRVTIEVDPQFDSVVYLRNGDCADAESEVACNDDATSGSGKRGSSSRGSRIDEVLEPGTYFVFVDGYGAEAGPFRMNVQIADVPTLAEACRQVRPLGAAKVAGTLTGGFDHAHASCGADAKGPDVPHRFDVAARARVRITEHSADFTPAVHLRKQCGDEHSEVACSDSAVKADEATWSGVLDPGAYVLFADSSDKDARGSYTLETELGPEAGAGVRGDACGDATNLSLNEKNVEGDTFLARDDVAGKCGGQGAPDVVYRFELARRSRVRAQFTSQEGNHVFVLTRSCADRAAELGCASILDDVLAPGVYFLAVDGAAAESLGRFTFSFFAHDVSGQEAACRSAPTLVEGRTVAGSTAGAGDRFTTSCGGRPDAQASPDRVHKLVLAARTRVRLLLTTPSWDGVLAIRRSCVDVPPAAQPSGRRVDLDAACNNDFQDAQHARIETTLDAGTYWVVVDGHQARNEGAYTLEYRTLK